jgi:uncharacterized membrane protein
MTPDICSCYSASLIATLINIVLVISCLISVIFYKMGKGTKDDLYDSIVVALLPITIMEYLLIIILFLMKANTA